MLWKNEGISCRWAPFLLYGPSVDVKNALEFIRRTDSALIDPSYKCNAHGFLNELERLIGRPNSDRTWGEILAFDEAYSQAFEHVSLDHLASNWVASSWVGGPSGPVSPSGDVYKVANFGKYPSIEEIESELDKLKIFEWLSLNLYVWDSFEEEANGDPDFGWKLAGGNLERTTDLPTEPRREVDLSTSIKAIMYMPSQARECTWTIAQIKEMWGDKISLAKAAGEAALRALPAEEPTS